MFAAVVSGTLSIKLFLTVYIISPTAYNKQHLTYC